MYYDIDEGTLVGWNSLPEAGYNKADQGSVSAGTGVIEVNYTAPTSSEEAKVTAKWVKGK